MKKNLNENEKKKKNDKENQKKKDVYVESKKRKKVNKIRFNHQSNFILFLEGERPAEQQQEEEEKKEEDDWKPYIPEIPSAALFAVYTSPDTFWLSMDDYDAGYLYHCQFSNKDDRFQYNPERSDTIVSTLPVPNTDPAHGEDIPLTSILIRYFN